jgi:hypothetical protein
MKPISVKYQPKSTDTPAAILAPDGIIGELIDSTADRATIRIYLQGHSERYPRTVIIITPWDRVEIL